MKSWQWPRIRPAVAGGYFALLFLGALSLASAQKAGSGLRGVTIYVLYGAGAVGAWVALPLATVFVKNAPRVTTVRYWLFYALSYGVFSVLSVAVARGIRAVVQAAFGLDLLLSQSLQSEVLLGVPTGAVVYAWLSAVLTIFQGWAEQRTLRVQAAELETKLAQSRLDALAARLDPHFLFNALNTVSSLMYEDLPRTERLIGDLGALLRAALAESGPTWTLAEEREHTERFVDFVEARFSGRVVVRWDLPVELAPTRVPRFALQVLVENAVKHNQSDVRRLTISITGERRSGQVALAVSDDGRGFDATPAQAGGALRRLDETLRLLHGAHAKLAREEAPGGGARVVLAVPEHGTP